MRKNIKQILSIYEESLGTFSSTPLNNKPKMLEFLRIAKTSKNLMVKYLPESPEKSARVFGLDFAINQIERDSAILVAQQRS